MYKYILTISSILLFGAVYSQTPMSMLVAKKASVATYKLIKVNMYDSANANLGKDLSAPGDGFNNWSINLANGTTCIAASANFIYSDGTQSTVNAKWVTGSNTCAIASNLDNSPQSWANGETTTYFDPIHFLSGSVTTTTPTSFIISGLNNAKTYDITILCARNTATSRPMTLSIGGAQSQTIDAKLNLTEAGLVKFVAVSPTSSTITVTITLGNGFGYMDAFVIKEN